MAIRVDSNRLSHYIQASGVLAAVLVVPPASAAIALAATGRASWFVAFWLSVWIPGLIFQDFFCWVGFTRRQEIYAVQVDLCFAVTEVSILAILVVTNSVSAATGIMALGGGALVGSLFGAIVVSRVRSSGSGRGVSALVEDLPTSRWFAADFAINFVLGQAYIAIALVMVGVAAVGAFRGVQTLFGPVSVLLMGVGSVSLARSAHEYLEQGWDAACAATRYYGAVIFAAGAIYVLLLWLLAEPVLSLVYGDVFSEFAVLVPWAGLELLVRALGHVPQVRMQILGKVRSLAMAKAFATFPSVVTVVFVLRAARTGSSVAVAAIIVAALWTGSAWAAYALWRRAAERSVVLGGGGHGRWKGIPSPLENEHRPSSDVHATDFAK